MLIAAASTPAQEPAEAAFPSRPVRLLVAQAAGGPTDVVARIYVKLSADLERWGKVVKAAGMKQQ
jgi:hypothetical protein